MSIEENAILKATIVQTLLSQHVKQIDFQFGCYHISHNMFKEVAGFIGNGTLHVVYDPDLNGGAYYDSDNDTLAFGFYRTNMATKLALIVHECLHAALDFHYQDFDINVLTSEALSYIAQAMYMYFASTGVLTGGLKEDAAAALADQLINHNPINLLDVTRLKVGIMCERKYWACSAKRANYNGIANEPLPAN